MLESVLADVLTRVLGQYLQGIDRDSVRFGAWSGLIELRNVALRPEALAVLFETLGVALPVTVESGFIGLLRLVVPWKAIGTTPVQIYMDGVTIVANPVRGDGSDDSQLEIRDRRIKRAKINTDDAVREASWDVTLQRHQPSQQQNSWSSWLVSDQLRATIVDNIQVHLTDIIIRFEDPYSNPKTPYVASIHCESFTIASANDQWKEAFVEQATHNTTRKLLEVKGFQIDWAPIIPSTPTTPLSSSTGLQNPDSSASLASPELLRRYVSSSSINEDDTDPPPAATRSLLHRVDGSMRLRLSESDHISSEPDFRQQDPAIDLDICFPDVVVDLNDVQYSCLVQTSLYFARIATRGFRPSTPKARWKWAVDQLLPNCTARHARSLRFTAAGLAETRRQRDSYIALRISLLKARRTAVEEPSQIGEELERMEDSIDFTEILAYRNAVDIQIAKIAHDWVPNKEQESPPEPEMDHGTTTSSFWSMLGYDDDDDKSAETPHKKPAVSTYISIAQPTTPSTFSQVSPTEPQAPEPRSRASLALRVGFLLRSATLRMSEKGFPVVASPRVELNCRDFRIGVKFSSMSDLIVEAVLGSVEAWDLQRNCRMVYSRSAAVVDQTPEGIDDESIRSSYPRDVSEAIESIRSGSNPAKELFLEEDSFDENKEKVGESNDNFLDDVDPSFHSAPSLGTAKRPGLRFRKSSHSHEKSRAPYRITEAEFLGNPHSVEQKYVAALRYTEKSNDGSDLPTAESATLDVSVATLEAIVDGPKGSFLWGLKFWQPKGMVQDPIMAFLGAAAGARIAELRMELEGALLADSVPMQVNAVILAPRFIIPSSVKSSPAIVVNLGTLGICTADGSLYMHGHTPSSSEPQHLPYANYVLTLDDLGMYFSPDLLTAVSRNLSAKPGVFPLVKGGLEKEDEPMSNISAVERIIRPFSLRFVLQSLRDSSVVQVAQGSSSQPATHGDGIAKIRLRGNIPELSLILTQKAFQHLLATAQEWTQGIRPSNLPQPSEALNNQKKPQPWKNVGEDGVSPIPTQEVIDGVHALANAISSDRAADKTIAALPSASTLAAYSVKVIVRTVSVELRESLEARLVTAVASDLSAKIVKRSKTNLRADLSLRSWSVTDGSRGSIAAFRRLLYSGTLTGPEGASPPHTQRENSDDQSNASSEDENFVTIRYLLDFATQEQEVFFRFLSLHMNCVRETYLRLVSFFDRVRKYVKDRRLSQRVSQATTMQTQPSLSMESPGKVRSSDGGTSPSHASIRKTSLISEFDGFKIQLVASSGIVAVFEMRDNNVHFLRDIDGKKRAWGSFGSFSIRDLTAPLREHVSVLVYERASQSSERVEKLEMAANEASELRTDEWVLSFPSSSTDLYHLQVTFEGIRMLFLYRFIAVLEEYVAALAKRTAPAVSPISDGKPADVEEGESFITPSGYTSISSQLLVSLDLRDLSFRIPRHSSCLSEAIIFNIWEVHVDNILEKDDIAWFAKFEGLQGAVQYVLPSRNESVGGMSVSSTFLTDCVAEVRIKPLQEGNAPADPMLGKVLDVANVQFTGPLRLNLSEAQYTVLYFVLTENVTETISGEDVAASLDEVQNWGDASLANQSTSQEDLKHVADDAHLSEYISVDPAFTLNASTTNVNVERITKKVAVRIPAISFELSRGWDVTQEACKIVGIYMKNVSLNLSVSTPRRLALEFGGTLLSVADLREDAPSVVKNFLVRLSRSNSEGILDKRDPPRVSEENISLSYQKEGTERPSIVISLNRLHIEVVPDLVRDLNFLAIPGWPFLETSVFAPDYEYVGRIVTMVLGESEILLFSEASSHDRRAIVLTGEFEVKMDWMRKTAAKTFYLRSKQLEISAVNEVPEVSERRDEFGYGFRDYSAQPYGKSHAPLIYPTDSVMEFVGPNVDESGRRVHISVDAALCLLCTSELPLLRAILNRLGALKPTYLSQRQWKQPGSAPGSVEEAKTVDIKEIQKRKARESLSLSLSIPASRYLVTDDSDGRFVPIIEAQLSSFSVQAHGKSMVQIDGQLSMDLFNPKKGCWEPALEPWSLSASMSRGQSGARAFVVRSDECLNINVMPTTVTAALTVARALRDAARKPEHAEKTNVHPNSSLKQEDRGDPSTSQRPSVAAFFVRNELGFPIMMNVPGKSKWTPIAQNSEVEVGAQSEALVSSTTNQEARTREKALRCLISIPSFAPQELSASEAGKQYVTFQPQRDLAGFLPGSSAAGDQDMPLRVLWEVELRNGVPVCTVRSPFRVVNDTKTKLDVVVVTGVKNVSRKPEDNEDDIITLEPGEYFSVPIHHCDGIVHVRPVITRGIESGDAQLRRPFVWSTSFPRLPWLLTLAQEKDLTESQISSSNIQQTYCNVPLIECKPRGGNSLGFFFKVIPSFGVPGESEQSTSWLDVSVRAPVILGNKLPRPLSYRVFQRGRAASSSSRLRDEVEKSVLAAGVANALADAHLHFSGEILNSSFISLAYENDSPNKSSADTVSSNQARMPSQFGPLACLADLESGRLKALSASPVEVKDVRGQVQKEFRTTVQALQGGISQFDFFARCWVRNRSDTVVEICSKSTFYGAGSSPLYLRDRPPCREPDEYVCCEGPYLSLRILRDVGMSENGEDLIDRSNWWTTPLVLEELDKPVIVNLPGRSLEVEVRPSIGLGCSTFIATIRNSAWIINSTDSVLQWCQQSSLDDHGNCPTRLLRSLPAGELQGLHWDTKSSVRSLHLRLADDAGYSEWIWSPAIPLDIGFSRELPAKMYRPKTHDQYIARVASKEIAGNSRALIIYKEDRQNPPYRIENLCEERAIAFSQLGSRERPWLVRGGKNTRYSWDDPLAPPDQRRLSIRILEKEDLGGSSPSSSNGSVGQRSRSMRAASSILNIDKVGDRSMVLSDPYDPAVIFNVSVDGATKVVTLHDEGFDIETYVASRPQRATEKATKVEAVPVVGWDDIGDNSQSDSAGIDNFEILSDYPATKKPSSTLTTSKPTTTGTDAAVFLDSIGVSLIGSEPKEIVYLSLAGLLLNYESAGKEQSIALTVEHFQIDNQLTKTPYPVLLWIPSQQMRNGDGSAVDDHDAVNNAISVDLHRDVSDNDIIMIKSFQAIVRPFNISFEEGLVTRMLQFLDDSAIGGEAKNVERLEGFDDEGHIFSTLIPGKADEVNRHQRGSTSSSKRIYIHDFHIGPSGIRLTSAGSGAAIAKAAGLNSSARTVIGLLLNVENCDFEFPSLSVQNAFDSFHHFLVRVRSYYLAQLQNQRIKLITSNSLVGNPAALFDAVGTGARDFLREPGRAKGSADFFASVGRGSKSLLTHTVGGIVESVSSIPRAVSSGLERAVGDNEYLAERDRIRGSNLASGYRGSSSKNPAQGLATGALSLAHGISSGVTGFIREPVQGARQGGAGGLLKGIGKAFIGGVAKPVAGAMDLVAEPVAGLSRQIAGADGSTSAGLAAPARPPRAFRGKSQRIECYDRRYSVGAWLLKAVSISSGAVVKSKLLNWVELSDRAERGGVESDVWVWFIVQRFSRSMPGMKKHVRADLKRHGRGQGPDARLEWKPEKTRVALLTKDCVIIATLDCKLVTMIPIWWDATYDIAGHGKEIVMKATITDLKKFGGEAEGASNGSSPLIQAPWDVSASTRRRKPAVGENVTDRIACGSEEAQNDLRNRLLDITGRNCSGTEVGSDGGVHDMYGGQELVAASLWRGENEREMRTRRESVRDWKMRDGGSGEIRSDMDGGDSQDVETGRSPASLKKVVKRLSTGVRKDRLKTTPHMRIIVANMLPGGLELLTGGTLEEGKWRIEAPVCVKGLDAQMMEVDCSEKQDEEKCARGHVVYDVIDTGKKGKERIGEIVFEFFNAQEGGASFTTKASAGFEAEFDRGNDGYGAVVFTVRKSIDEVVGVSGGDISGTADTVRRSEGERGGMRVLDSRREMGVDEQRDSRFDDNGGGEAGGMNDLLSGGGEEMSDDEKLVKQLVDIGFKFEDAIGALAEAGGDLVKAVDILTR